MSAPLAPLACLAVAGGWQAITFLADCRWINRLAGDRAYRPELGWTDARLVAARRRWAVAGLVSAIAIVLAGAGRASGILTTGPAAVAIGGACLTILAWLIRDRQLHRGRYTSICLGTLAIAVLLYEMTALAVDDPGRGHEIGSAGVSAAVVAGVFASMFASQLYLVAGIRKLRSAGFMSGRVLVDNLAYAIFQGGAGNPDFPRLVAPSHLPGLLRNRVFLGAGRAASVLTVGLELAVGAGAAGLLPAWTTLALAVPMNLSFLLVSPRRIVTFAVAAFGLLLLATASPLLPVFA